MEEHVAVRCGEYSLLFPAENVGLIEPVPADTKLVPGRGHRGTGELLIDLRRLLGVASPLPVERCVMLRWRSTDGAREATLIVDVVDEIVNCHPGDLISAAILPARLRPLCDQVMRARRGALRLRVKPDVILTMRRREDRRRFIESWLTRATAPAREVSR
jgi:hypothetical protein